MKRITSLLVFLMLFGLWSMAQDIQISGKVTNVEDGSVLPGVSVVVKGTTNGTTTNVNGEYTLSVPADATLVFTFIGMQSQEIVVGGQTTINIDMSPDVVEVQEVVVTALGITREKKSLGYAIQEVDGDDINAVKSENFLNSLSGKVAGVNIKVNGNMGGSTNVVIRGAKSLYGSNQALFVVDGVPIDNSNSNNAGQISGRSGFDYGNAASDINASDIESLTVLKGSAATALYGSRAANGVIMITTKKGSKTAGKKVGVTISSNVTVGVIDKSTFPEYQRSYGGGYGHGRSIAVPDDYWYSPTEHSGFELNDVNGDGVDDYTVPYYEDGSFGEPFDPNVLVYQYNAFIPESEHYGEATPWVPSKNEPITFFDNAVGYTNNIDVSGGSDKSTFRLSYTNKTFTGIMPNSSLKTNNILFTGTYDVLKNLKVSASAQYTYDNNKGRNPTGYNDNIMSSFRQWYQVNTDIQEQKELYDLTKTNATWNPNSWDDRTPAYWNNPYWDRYENYETDSRNRMIGYSQIDWKATEWLSFMGRLSVDTYSELQEERKAVGSVSGELGVGRPDVTSGYSRFTRNFIETNMDLMANVQKDLTPDLNLNAFIGTNFRRSQIDEVFASTNGGLSVPNVYALSNSTDPMLPPEEILDKIGVNGYFGSASLGFKDFLFLDGTVRNDISSTLPENSRSYVYPSVTGSVIFSELLDAPWLTMGKVRLNYAEVGSGAPWGSVKDSYTPIAPFSGNPLVSVSGTKNNENLKPERTKSLEGGLAMNFFLSRLGFDLSLYRTNTIDLITPIQVSFATGNTFKYLNAGDVENKGVEISLNITPVRISSFSWDITVNWAKNTNKVIKLAEELENLPINDGLQGGVTINARLNESYGVIQGTDFVFDSVSGERIVRSNGYYLLSPTSDIIIGNTQPDWTGGIDNNFRFKNFSFGFLIDMQQGGDIFSLDQWYGQGTGLYPESVYTNDLGNPVRSQAHEDPFDISSPLLENPGGLILDGVKADGTPNDVRIEGGDYRPWGWARNPNSAFIYDASYVKLRELRISYELPSKIMEKTFISGASVSFVGSNLWIIHKNLPYADPEASQSSGNTQGWQSGVMPTTRNFGFNLKLQF